MVTCTQIVWTYIFELAFLHEGINGFSLGGTCLILGFMLYVGYLKIKQSDTNNFQEEQEGAALLLDDAKRDSICGGVNNTSDGHEGKELQV